MVTAAREDQAASTSACEGMRAAAAHRGQSLLSRGERAGAGGDQSPGRRAGLGRILAPMAHVRRLTGDADGAIAAGQKAFALAAALGDSALQAQASYELGQAYHLIGDFGRAVELLQRSLEVADRESGRLGTDLRIESRAWLARTLGMLGAFAEGRRHGEAALRLATLEGRGYTDHCPHPSRTPVPRPRGPGACHPGTRPRPGPLSCLRPLDQFAIDCGGPGLCLCAARAPR